MHEHHALRRIARACGMLLLSAWWMAARASLRRRVPAGQPAGELGTSPPRWLPPLF